MSGLSLCPCGCQRQVMEAADLFCIGCKAEFYRSAERSREIYFEKMVAAVTKRECTNEEEEDEQADELLRLMAAAQVPVMDFIGRRRAERLHHDAGVPWVGASPPDRRPWGYHRELTADAVDLKEEWKKHERRRALEEASAWLRDRP